MRTRYIYRGAEVIAVYKAGELVYRSPKFEQNENQSALIMRDIQPYRSMIDGSVISSRSRHREHLSAHGCVEVGNETKHLKQRPVQTPPGLKDTVARLIYERLRYK
jgi:hypothetical protein